MTPEVRTKPIEVFPPAPDGGRDPMAEPSATRPIADDVAIRVDALSKLYKVYPHPSAILKELIFRKTTYTPVWALQDVSFSVKRGEIVGIVGANGAGKSTLLRILAQTLEAHSGSFHINGQLRAILQLGTGFHEEYTGRENIFMGGYCLGYSKAEIEESLDWIISFSGLRRVIDQPFRTYSSGMKSRLTFSVTFCRKPDILIVDEALATGDLAFQQKCINRITDLCSGGSTALVVSHSMFFIETLCSRALYLRDGRLVEDGHCRDITKQYEEELLREFAETKGTDQHSLVDPVDADEPTKVMPDSDSPPVVTVAAPAPRSDDPLDLNDPAYPPVSSEIQHLLDDPEEICPAIKHLNLVRLQNVRVLDADLNPCDRFHTGDSVIIEMEVESLVAKDNVAVGVQVFNEADVHVLTSSNLTQINSAGQPTQTRINLRRGRQMFRVSFPSLFLCDGKYHLGVGIAPKAKHFTEADQLLRVWRVAFFGFYRDDLVYKQIYDPPSVWDKVLPSNTQARD